MHVTHSALTQSAQKDVKERTTTTIAWLDCGYAVVKPRKERIPAASQYRTTWTVWARHLRGRLTFFWARVSLLDAGVRDVEVLYEHQHMH